jgi:predicted metal-binding membrane protein
LDAHDGGDDGSGRRAHDPRLPQHSCEQGREHNGPFLSTWVFAAGYLLVWTLAGVVAYAGALAVETIALRATLSPEDEARIGGMILVAAGFYQLSPLKERCLAKCRNSTVFVTRSWRDGTSGALLMGLLHGGWCLGCCWLLFVILFPLGVMNTAAMAIVTIVITAEKTLPWPVAVSAAMAAALAIYGAIVVATPEITTILATP